MCTDCAAANRRCANTGRNLQQSHVIRPPLTQREREVLLAWLLGSDTKESVAMQLFITDNTVKKHIERIRGKYVGAGRPAPTKTDLLIRALQDGYLDVHDL